MNDSERFENVYQQLIQLNRNFDRIVWIVILLALGGLFLSFEVHSKIERLHKHIQLLEGRMNR